MSLSIDDNCCHHHAYQAIHTVPIHLSLICLSAPVAHRIADCCIARFCSQSSTVLCRFYFFFFFFIHSRSVVPLLFCPRHPQSVFGSARWLHLIVAHLIRCDKNDVSLFYCVRLCTAVKWAGDNCRATECTYLQQRSDARQLFLIECNEARARRETATNNSANDVTTHDSIRPTLLFAVKRIMCVRID